MMGRGWAIVDGSSDVIDLGFYNPEKDRYGTLHGGGLIGVFSTRWQARHANKKAKGIIVKLNWEVGY